MREGTLALSRHSLSSARPGCPGAPIPVSWKSALPCFLFSSLTAPPAPGGPQGGRPSRCQVLTTCGLISETGEVTTGQLEVVEKAQHPGLMSFLAPFEGFPAHLHPCRPSEAPTPGEGVLFAWEAAPDLGPDLPAGSLGLPYPPRRSSVFSRSSSSATRPLPAWLWPRGHTAMDPSILAHGQVLFRVAVL